jgi:toxin FitB
VFLLDTNVISELRKNKPHGALLSWVHQQADEHLFLCAVTVGEIQVGIELARLQDPVKALELEVWLKQLTVTYDVLPVDVLAFREWARLMHRKSPDLSEAAMIAAVAKTRGLTVATRNTADFKGFGVAAVNPFKG